jgi:CBS domain-containing protein
MKVNDIMTKNPLTCTPDTTAAEAAHLMWEADCGILPVINNGGIDGVVTDRDLYVALATRNEPASYLRVGAVTTKTITTCAPEDDVHRALALMKQERVRRIPVVGFDGAVVGIVSINDLVRIADNSGEVTSEQVLDALKAICSHQPNLVAV